MTFNLYSLTMNFWWVRRTTEFKTLHKKKIIRYNEKKKCEEIYQIENPIIQRWKMVSGLPHHFRMRQKLTVDLKFIYIQKIKWKFSSILSQNLESSWKSENLSFHRAVQLRSSKSPHFKCSIKVFLFSSCIQFYVCCYINWKWHFSLCAHNFKRKCLQSIFVVNEQKHISLYVRATYFSRFSVVFNE